MSLVDWSLWSSGMRPPGVMERRRKSRANRMLRARFVGGGTRTGEAAPGPDQGCDGDGARARIDHERANQSTADSESPAILVLGPDSCVTTAVRLHLVQAKSVGRMLVVRLLILGG